MRKSNSNSEITSRLSKMKESSNMRLLQQKKPSKNPITKPNLGKEKATTGEEDTTMEKTKKSNQKTKGRAVEKNRKNTFRAEGKNWLLTYPQCSMSKKEAIERLTSSERDLGVQFACASQEHHADGELHLHIIVGLEKKLSTRRADYWDFVCGKHGDYKVIKFPKKAYAYVTKEDKEPTVYGTIPKNFLESSTSKGEDVAKMIMSGCTVAKVVQEMPGYALVNLTKIISFKNYITNVLNTKSRKELALPISYKGTDNGTQRIVEWLNGNLNGSRQFKQKQLWISGSANMRKTTLLIKLDEYFRTYPLPLGEEFYDTYDDEAYDLILVDEYKSQKTITFLNAFVQGGLSMILRIKGGQITKRKNLPVIVCSNHTIIDAYSKANFVSVSALRERFEEIELNEPIDLDNIEWEKADQVSIAQAEIDKGKEEEIEVEDSEEEEVVRRGGFIYDSDYDEYIIQD